MNDYMPCQKIQSTLLEIFARDKTTAKPKLLQQVH